MVKYFVAMTRVEFEHAVAKHGFNIRDCVLITDVRQLRGVNDVTIHVLPRGMLHPNFQEIYKVALSRNLKMEILNV